MKNEAVAKAITEIDDELVIEAHGEDGASARSDAPRRSGRMLTRYLGAAMAACLVLAAGIAFGMRPTDGGPKIMTGGVMISSEPTALSASVGEEFEYRTAANEYSVVVPIDIKNKDRLTLRTEVGTVNVYGPAADSLLSSGLCCTVDGSAYIEWVIDSPDTLGDYKLLINEDIELTLRYSDLLKDWTIIREN